MNYYRIDTYCDELEIPLGGAVRFALLLVIVLLVL